MDNVAVISHSGLGLALFDRGRAAGLGFDYIVSTGNEVDVDVTDLLEELLAEGKVRVFLLVVEGFRATGRFLAVADRVRRAGKSRRRMRTTGGRSWSGVRCPVRVVRVVIGVLAQVQR